MQILKRLAPAIMVGVLAIGGGYALASSTATPTVHGCINNRTHQLTVQEHCARGTRPLVWNQRGPQGDRGLTGKTGPTGPKGATGATGGTDQTVVSGLISSPDMSGTQQTGGSTLGGGCPAETDSTQPELCQSTGSITDFAAASPGQYTFNIPACSDEPTIITATTNTPSAGSNDPFAGEAFTAQVPYSGASGFGQQINVFEVAAVPSGGTSTTPAPLSSWVAANGPVSFTATCSSSSSRGLMWVRW